MGGHSHDQEHDTCRFVLVVVHCFPQLCHSTDRVGILHQSEHCPHAVLISGRLEFNIAVASARQNIVGIWIERIMSFVQSQAVNDPLYNLFLGFYKMCA